MTEATAATPATTQRNWALLEALQFDHAADFEAVEGLVARRESLSSPGPAGPVWGDCRQGWG